MSHSHGATRWGQEVATRRFPTLSEGDDSSAPRPPVPLRPHGGGRARPRVAWGARARSTLLAALIIIIIITTKVNRLFGGLNIPQNMSIFACTSVAV